MPQGGTNIGAALSLASRCWTAPNAAPRTGSWCSSRTVRTSRGRDGARGSTRSRTRASGSTPWASAPSRASRSRSSARNGELVGYKKDSRRKHGAHPARPRAGFDAHRRGDRRRVLLPAARRRDGRGRASGSTSSRRASSRAESPSATTSGTRSSRFRVFCRCVAGDGGPALAPEGRVTRATGSRAPSLSVLLCALLALTPRDVAGPGPV